MNALCSGSGAPEIRIAVRAAKGCPGRVTGEVAAASCGDGAVWRRAKGYTFAAGA